MPVLESSFNLYTDACNLENTSRLNQFKLALALILVGYLKNYSIKTSAV